MHDLPERLDRLCRLLGRGGLACRAREYGVAEHLERVLDAVRETGPTRRGCAPISPRWTSDSPDTASTA
ncbi:hypothetical protein [Streptomyces massasporeus]|uniref:hypothetical protein n=1 Tax=Streptomyces massasporeus TaxID=67324 RepID=UPI00381B95E5